MRMHTIFLTNRQVSVFTPSNRSGTIASDIIGSRFVNFLSKFFPSTSTNKPQTWAARRWTATWGRMKWTSVNDNYNWIWQWNWPKRNYNNDNTEVAEILEAKKRYHRWFTIEHLVFSSVLASERKLLLKIYITEVWQFLKQPAIEFSWLWVTFDPWLLIKETWFIFTLIPRKSS